MARKYIRYVTKDKLDKVSEKNQRLVKRYFNTKNMNLSDASKKSYQSDFNQWLVFINEKFQEGILEHEYILDILEEEDGTDDMVDMLEEYVAFCTGFLGNNERRIQRRLSSISSFFLFLRKKRKIRENPVEFIERPSVSVGEKPQVLQTFLTEEQIEDIRKGLQEIGNTQLELYFEFSLSTMARVNAVSNVKIEQIDFKRNVVERVLEKEQRLVDLFPSTYTLELINKWLKEREELGIESEYLFLTRYRGQFNKVHKNTLQSSWVKKIGAIIDIPELHAHDLRHSGSSIMFNKGMALEDVQQVLNHKSPTVTMNHYIKQDIKKLQDAKKAYEI